MQLLEKKKGFKAQSAEMQVNKVIIMFLYD